MTIVYRPRFMYGDECPLDIPEEEFLSARPPALTPAQLVAMEIDPPDWALGRPAGRRQPKRERQFASQIIPFEKVNGNDYSPTGPPLPGFLNNRVNQDAEMAYNRVMDKRRRKQALRNTPKARKVVPAGNLLNDDYRFWKGYATPDPGGQCKWCNGLFLTRKVMADHHFKGKCKERLLALYKFIKLSHSQHYCLSCKKSTGHFMWGVPICNTPSCIARWKFTVRDHLDGFVQYLEWAQEAQDQDPVNGPFGHLPPEPVRGSC